MIQNEILEQASLNESPNFISMQGIADWLYSKTNTARINLQSILDNEIGSDQDFYQAGKYSIKISDLREIFNGVDQEVNKTYSVLNISTGNSESVSGDDVVDQIKATFESNEVIAAGFEVLGSSSEDLSAMAGAYSARVQAVCGSDALKTEHFKLVQKTILDGNGTVKGKTGNMVSLLSVQDSGNNKVSSSFDEYTGATPSSIWSNAIWPAITSCVSSIASVTAIALGGIFGVAGNAVLSLGKAIINAYRISVNPNLINMFNSHSIRGSLNALNESLMMSTIEYASGYTTGTTKSRFRAAFVAFHNSRNFMLNSICCYTIPGAYILLAITQWTDQYNFTGKIAIAPKVGNTNFFDYCVANKYEDANIRQLEANGYYNALRSYLASDSSAPIDLSGDAKSVKNMVSTSVAASLLEAIAFLTAYQYKSDSSVDDGLDYILDMCMKYAPVSSTQQGANLINECLSRASDYHYYYDTEDATWKRESAGSIITVDLSQFREDTAPYSNADILWLARSLTPADSPKESSTADGHNYGNLAYISAGIMDYLIDVLNADESAYFPHVWLSNQPIGYAGIRSDKTLAAIYYANLAAAIAITATTAITIGMAVAFRGAKKKAYVYRGYADNMSWNADPNDKKALKACWKANRRAIRWEKIAGTYDSAADTTTSAINASANNLDVAADPTGLITPGGTLYNVLGKVGVIDTSIETTVEPSLSEIKSLIK